MTGISNEAYNMFKKHKSLTDVQLQKLLNVNPNSVRPARLKLEEMGLITRTTEKKQHRRGRRGTNERTGHYTIYKLVSRPRKVEPASATQKKINRMLNKIRQLETSLIALAKGIEK